MNFPYLPPIAGLSWLLSLLGSSLLAQSSIANWYDLKWQADLGLSTYRTQITYDATSQTLIFPSNGERLDRLNDPKDGVYLLDPATGEVKQHLHQDGPIDGDVNGVAVAGSRIYFGDDQRTVYCYRNGKQHWYYPIKVASPTYQGDLERAPVLTDLTDDGLPDVIIAAEEYGLLALDGRDGTRLWEIAGQSGHGHGLNRPAVLDVNDDGTPDVIWGSRSEQTYRGPEDHWGTYGDWVMALDGKTGIMHWQVPMYSAVHASPLVYQQEGKTYLLVAETYSKISLLSLSGEILAQGEFSLPDGGISAFFSSPFVTTEDRLIIGTSWWGEEDGVWVIDLTQRMRQKEGSAPIEAGRFIQAGRVSATAVSGDVLPAPGKEVLIPTENGELLIFNQVGDLLQRLTLPTGAEASVLVEDIDQDGKPELLLAGLDGVLYCYETESK
jgi:outer membrane protein assembly factor BamB